MRRLLAIVAVLAGVTATAGHAATSRAAHGPLTGTWTGVLSDGSRNERITLTINGAETRGTWKVGASCRGTLVLDSISNGYHHYRRDIAAGSTCAGGDVDCIERAGTKVFDTITPRTDGWGRSGTLRRVRTQ